MSNVPPPFSMPPAAPPRKDKTGTIILVIILAFVGVCVLGAIVTAWVGFTAMQKVMPAAMANVGCELNFKSVHSALKEYSDDHGGKLPPAETWQEALKPYVKKRLDKARAEMADAPDFVQIKFMDPEGMWGCDYGADAPKSGMAFNKAFGGKKIAELTSKDADILVFETKTQAMNQALKYEAPAYADSPKFMGTLRGWLVLTWNGGTKVVSKDGSLKESNFESSMDSSSSGPENQ